MRQKWIFSRVVIREKIEIIYGEFGRNFRASGGECENLAETFNGPRRRKKPHFQNFRGFFFSFWKFVPPAGVGFQGGEKQPSGGRMWRQNIFGEKFFFP